jgi:hypothetical protein
MPSSIAATPDHVLTEVRLQILWCNRKTFLILAERVDTAEIAKPFLAAWILLGMRRHRRSVNPAKLGGCNRV